MGMPMLGSARPEPGDKPVPKKPGANKKIGHVLGGDKTSRVVRAWRRMFYDTRCALGSRGGAWGAQAESRICICICCLLALVREQNLNTSVGCLSGLCY